MTKDDGRSPLRGSGQRRFAVEEMMGEITMRETVARALAMREAKDGPQSIFIDRYESHTAYVEARWRMKLGAADAVLDAIIDAALASPSSLIEQYAREASIALTRLSGGGSEMFTRIGDEFYAEPALCVQRAEHKAETIRRLQDRQHLSQSKPPEEE